MIYKIHKIQLNGTQYYCDNEQGIILARCRSIDEAYKYIENNTNDDITIKR